MSAFSVGSGTYVKNAADSLFDLLGNMPKNEVIRDNFIKAYKIVNDPQYRWVVVSVSGGSDSDLLVDIITKVDVFHKALYVFCDTGLELKATKEHLDYLEARYGITIIRKKAVKPIPTCCKEYGQPFLSKNVSTMIERLQKYDFQWEDEDFYTLLQKYCVVASEQKAVELECKAGLKRKQRHRVGKWTKIDGVWYRNCVQALRWWSNACGDGSRFNIERYAYLKDFIIQNNGVPFKVSNKCCLWAKKRVIKTYFKELKKGLKKGERILSIVGTRKAEGGARSTAYKNCYSVKEGVVDEYRPVFFYSNKDKSCYNEFFQIQNSAAYTEYKMPRTGCCCCPYALGLEAEKEVVKEYEPNLYKAVENVFGDSYRFKEEYYSYRKLKKSSTAPLLSTGELFNLYK